MISRMEEYNREMEALRVNERVENMIQNEDYTGARDTLESARDLFPLDEFLPKLTVCAILSAASNGTPGVEIDYYWVLQVEPSATIFDINGQYQKFRNTLQSLKHYFPGTDMALKLIEDAFLVLSDDQKRSKFNLQRSTAWENYESPPVEALVPLALSGMIGGIPARVYKPDYATMLKKENMNLSSFTGQVWAIYFGRDKMPRQYVLIHDVFSRTQVLVKFLEPEPDFDNSWWLKSLPISCGVFSIGEVTMDIEISQLSHLVKVGNVMPSYVIYPIKGEIWAMYHGWNCEWELSDLETCNYWIVEVLSDFSEGEKIMVAKLVEMKGCFTFFQRQQLHGFELISEISRAEIHSFSHRIPFLKVPGIGDYGISESSLHLEPYCLPPKWRKLAEN